MDKLAPRELGNVLEHIAYEPVSFWPLPGLEPHGLGLDFNDIKEIWIPLEQRLYRR
jgi:hypothetical protein